MIALGGCNVCVLTILEVEKYDVRAKLESQACSRREARERFKCKSLCLLRGPSHRADSVLGGKPRDGRQGSWVRGPCGSETPSYRLAESDYSVCADSQRPCTVELWTGIP